MVGHLIVKARSKEGPSKLSHPQQFRRAISTLYPHGNYWRRGHPIRHIHTVPIQYIARSALKLLAACATVINHALPKEPQSSQNTAFQNTATRSEFHGTIPIGRPLPGDPSPKWLHFQNLSPNGCMVPKSKPQTAALDSSRTQPMNSQQRVSVAISSNDNPAAKSNESRNR
jgi:hypothetical protein